MQSNRRKLSVGERFGRLTIIRIAPNKSTDGRTLYVCKCDCGNEVISPANRLKRGNTKSCGCFKRDAGIAANTTHGMSKTRIYRVWASMKDRCCREKCSHYPAYGGRGISVCDEWRNSFESFYKWAMENGYKAGLTIERKNVNGNYCPENCCWITSKEQGANKSTTVRLTKDGETHFVHEWAALLGINADTIYSRKQAGFSDEDCLYAGRLPKSASKKAGDMDVLY